MELTNWIEQLARDVLPLHPGLGLNVLFSTRTHIFCATTGDPNFGPHTRINILPTEISPQPPRNFNILISTYKGIPIANLSLMSVLSLQTAHLPSHMIGSCGGDGGAAEFFLTSNPPWCSAPLTCKARKPEKVLSVTVWTPLLCSRSNSSLLSPWKSFSANLARLLYLKDICKHQPSLSIKVQTSKEKTDRKSPLATVFPRLWLQKFLFLPSSCSLRALPPHPLPSSNTHISTIHLASTEA